MLNIVTIIIYWGWYKMQGGAGLRGGTEHRYKTWVCGTHSTDFLHCQRYTGQVAAPRDCMIFAGRRD